MILFLKPPFTIMTNSKQSIKNTIFGERNNIVFAFDKLQL